MNKTIQLSAIVTATVLVAGLIGVGFSKDAFASDKIVDNKFINFAVILPTNGSFCGNDVTADGKNTGFVRVWDTDNSGTANTGDEANTKVTAHFDLLDANGDKVGTWSTKIHKHGSVDFVFGSLIVVADENHQDNSTVTCDGVGQVQNVHFGFTVDQNGGIHPHSP
ncbi:MAG: hypothetical protein OEM21_03780 [Nitrosopumilus sp.]|nr:hypothetical protein [Nitrosopumilus sp.]